MPWFILSNGEGVILAVYGAALEANARAKGKEIASSTGCGVALHYCWLESRPHVGGSISMRGQYAWLL
jgi:hypothetical protein